VIAYDTNIFIYYFESAANPKQATAAALIEAALERRDAIISFQVVQETLNVLTTAARRPATASDAGEFLERVLLPVENQPERNLVQTGTGTELALPVALL
jgi:predicted nucleic acid-binding protein